MKYAVALFVAVLLFAGGFFLRGVLDKGAQQQLEAETTRRLDSIATVNAAERARLLQVVAQAKADSAVAAAESERLRREASQHAARDRAKDRALADAKTAGDSVPILVEQRDEARAAYATLEASFASHLRADTAHFRVDQLHMAQDSLDRVEVAAREAALKAMNARLAGDLLRAQNRGKFLGLIRIPGEVKLIAAVAGGYCLAKC